MLSSRVYNLLQKMIFESEITFDAECAKELWDITHPYVVCIHRPTRRAFLLNRQYMHITDVSACNPPKKFTEFTANHLCAGDLPAWVYECASKDFDSYWLY